MRQNGEKTDEKRMALLQEYLSSGMSRTAFEKEKGLGHCTISRWFRIFAVEDKPAVSSQATVTDMKNNPDKEDLLQEIDRLKQELRLKSLDLKRTEMARDAYERMPRNATASPSEKNPMPSNHVPCSGGACLQDSASVQIAWHITMGLLQA